MKLINHLQTRRTRTKHKRTLQEFIFNVVPLNTIDFNQEKDFVQIIGSRVGQPDKHEKFNIDRLYYTEDVKSLIIEGLSKSQPIRIQYIKYIQHKLFGLSRFSYIKRRFTGECSEWTVIKIQSGKSNNWIEIDEQSKLFDKDIK